MPTHRKFARITAAALTASALVLASALVPAAGATKSYTLAQVKTHKSATNCWAAVSGKVYNLTKWIAKHPGGGPFIKAMCGKDATPAFKGQHGLNGRPASMLAAYRIGVLTKTRATAR
jgi:cytochrome b involved in lipid metabolism